MPKTALRVWAAVAAALYAALAYGSYVTLPALAGGILGFDMRPLGMKEAEGLAYLEAMSKAGREYYLDWLKLLDTAFIMTLTGFLLAQSWRLKGLVGGVAAIAALAYAGFDLLENAHVASLVSLEFENGEIAMIEDIGALTRGKFASLGAAAVVLILAWKGRVQPANGEP